jgi:hypothetical protein
MFVDVCHTKMSGWVVVEKLGNEANLIHFWTWTFGVKKNPKFPFRAPEITQLLFLSSLGFSTVSKLLTSFSLIAAC